MRKGEKHLKYTYEQKYEVVMYGEKNHLTNHELSLRYGIAKTTVRDWRRQYRTSGSKGLERKQQELGRKNHIYTPEFRIKVVKERLEGNYSYRELGEKYGMNRCTIQAWVTKYLEKGEESLKVNMTGRASKKDIPRTKITKRQKKDIGREVYNELELLRSEVAYLKKLRALIWERQEFEQKRKPVSYTS